MEISWTREEPMKELFTKSFWESVKKTFDQAQEDPPPATKALQTPAEGELNSSSTPETPRPVNSSSSPSQ
jgi:hypothetical protein